ncbi:uncharacterized protein LOC144356778 [Saccoglossus kowalevskii]
MVNASSPRQQWSSILKASTSSPLFPSIKSWKGARRRLNLTDSVQSFMTDQKSSPKIWVSPTLPPALQTQRGSTIESIPREQVTETDSILSHVAMDYVTLDTTSVRFRREKTIKTTYMQLVRLNYLVNVVNFIARKQVENTVSKELQQIQELSSHLKKQTATIIYLNGLVNTLKLEVEQQNNLLARVKGSLESQKQLFESSIQQNHQEREKCESLLKKYQIIINELLQGNMKHDFLVDSSIVGVCIYLVNSVLVEYPLSTLMTFVSKEKLKKWFYHFIRLLLLLYLFRIFKTFSVTCGIHNRVGNLVRYLLYAYKKIRRLYQSLRGRKCVDENLIFNEPSMTILDIC